MDSQRKQHDPTSLTKETKGRTSAILVCHIRKTLRHGSQFYLQITPCLPFLRKRSPDGTSPN